MRGLGGDYHCPDSRESVLLAGAPGRARVPLPSPIQAFLSTACFPLNNHLSLTLLQRAKDAALPVSQRSSARRRKSEQREGNLTLLDRLGALPLRPRQGPDPPCRPLSADLLLRWPQREGNRSILR